jgi:poly(A) polymerase
MVEWQGNIGGAIWLENLATKKIIDALGEDAIRFVGGAVRDELLGLKKGEFMDVDIACLYPPDKVTALLENNSIKVIPTGLKHGTVTAVIGDKTFEITTLRHDVETFGRHANVEFHDNWEEDAKRRDFTLNALYANTKGDVLDYIDGFKDLKVGKIRFIGDAKTRIEEDALRILRFFRFFAHYGKGKMDKNALTASVASKALLETLSVERILLEFLKLISARDPLPCLRVMEENGILDVILPEAEPVDNLKDLIPLEIALGEGSPIRRLSCLLPKKMVALKAVAERLKFSNDLRGHLRALQHLDPNIHIGIEPLMIKHVLYHYGYVTFRDQLILKSKKTDLEAINRICDIARDMEIPKFPVRGGDLIALGYEANQKLGEAISHLEELWLESNFKFSKEDLLRSLD